MIVKLLVERIWILDLDLADHAFTVIIIYLLYFTLYPFRLPFDP